MAIAAALNGLGENEGSGEAIVVVVVAGDPGGAAALTPVIRLLAEEGRHRLILMAYRQATAIWAPLNLPCIPLGDAPIDAVARLRAARAKALLTASSVNGVDHEKRLVDAARECGIPSLGVLDFWSNYRARYFDANGISHLPDRIAIMDVLAARQMRATGFPVERLVVTGQPAFSPIPSLSRCAGRDAARRRLGVKPQERLVLFASQPLTAYYRQFHGDAAWLGYEEHGVAAMLHSTLTDVRRRLDMPLRLCIQPHPRESRSVWSPAQASSVPVVIAPRTMPGRQLAIAADLVVGMNSAFLLEACLLGRPVLSLQPGLRRDDALPANAWKASRGVYRRSRLLPALLALLGQGSPGGGWLQRRRMPLYGNAASRIVAELAELIEQTKP